MASGLSPAAALRVRQIDSLVKDHAEAQTRDMSRSVIDLPLDSHGHTLRVTLPAGFPEAAPMVTVLPAGVHHPLVAGNGALKWLDLECWSPHVSLSRVVGDIKQAFQRQPIQKAHQDQHQHHHQQQQIHQYHQQNQPPPQQQQQQQQGRALAVPAATRRRRSGSLPQTFREVSSYSVSSLELLIHDEEALLALVGSLDVVVEAEREESAIRGANSAATEANSLLLADLREIEERRARVKEEADAASAELAELEARKRALMARIGPAAGLAYLRQKAEQAAAQSEKLAVEDPAQLQDFIKARKTMHLHLLAKERLISEHPSLK